MITTYYLKKIAYNLNKRGMMKLKDRLNKHRDEQAQETYWSSPERYNIEAFQRGFNCAVTFILSQKEIKNMEDIEAFLALNKLEIDSSKLYDALDMEL